MTRAIWPKVADGAGWAAVAAAGELGECPPGLVVGALRALFRDGERRLVQALTLDVSDRITRRLRRLIGTNHPNEGEDIIERAHGTLMEAVFDLGSADGVAPVEAFGSRVRFRGIDAAWIEAAHHHRHPALPTDGDGEALIPEARRVDGDPGSADASHLLLRVAVPKRRLAFRLFMDGMRVRQGHPCVADVLGCDPKTAARWVAEARATLVAEIGA